jgi:predicted ArsR family transcriptional regulator
VSTDGWTFLSNHAHVLLAVAQDSDARIRDLAERVGVTERGAQLIVNDLVTTGYLTRSRVGRRNSYRLAPGRPFRHRLERGHSVDELLALFVGDPSEPTTATPLPAGSAQSG